MSRRVQLGLAIALVVVGAVGLASVATLGSRGSVRAYIRQNYEQESVEAGGRSAVYRSANPPAEVVADIAGKWPPADRINDPAGYFLRYRNEFVAVGAGDEGRGSRIHVDDERRGYSRWFVYVGGRWGTSSGRGEGFRGGGPGTGK